MQPGVSIDGPNLNQTAKRIRENAETFKSKYELIFENVRKNVDQDFSKEGLAWTGNKAAIFVQELNNVEKEFVAAYNAIIKEAEDLENQVAAWTQFDA